MNFCKDCKHSELDKTYGKELHCMHPSIKQYDLVTGDIVMNLVTGCHIQRYFSKSESLLDCGKEGKYFEPKE